MLGMVSAAALAALPFHLALAAGTVIGVGGMAAIGYKITRETPRPGRSDAKSLGLAALAGIALSVFGSGFLALEAALVPAFAEQIAQHQQLMERIVRRDTPEFVPIVLIVVAVLPAIFEEVLFRGVLRQYLTRSLGRVGRVLALGVLFGLLHVSPLLLLPLIYAGMVWTLLAERTDGWVAPAVSHFSMNATSAVVLIRIDTLDDLGILVAMVFVWVGSALAAAAIAAVPDKRDDV